MPDNRSYPDANNVATWYASKSSEIASADDVVVGTHIGTASAGGVTADLSLWSDYTAVHRIDNPSDGINDSADYVVYFSKNDADPKELYKATNGDISTLVQLTEGAEYDNFYGFTADSNPVAE